MPPYLRPAAPQQNPPKRGNSRKSHFERHTHLVAYLPDRAAVGAHIVRYRDAPVPDRWRGASALHALSTEIRPRHPMRPRAFIGRLLWSHQSSQGEQLSNRVVKRLAEISEGRAHGYRTVVGQSDKRGGKKWIVIMCTLARSFLDLTEHYVEAARADCMCNQSGVSTGGYFLGIVNLDVAPSADTDESRHNVFAPFQWKGSLQRR